MNNLYSLYFCNINQIYHIFKGHITSNGVCILKNKIPMCDDKFSKIDISNYKFKCSNQEETREKLIKYLDSGLDICPYCLDKITSELKQN